MDQDLLLHITVPSSKLSSSFPSRFEIDDSLLDAKLYYSFFFFNDTATTEIYTLSLHDASSDLQHLPGPVHRLGERVLAKPAGAEKVRDRKSTRLNSSHVEISYAVFCLKKKK